MAEDNASPTHKIATWVTNLTPSTIPQSARHAALRSLYNYLGCTLHGSSHPTVHRAHAAVRPFTATPTSTIIGTAHDTDAQHAALLNGTASHVHDYDDTHLATIIHPTGPVASALLACAQHLSASRHTSGRDLLAALVAGIEVECKLGLAVYPRHYDAGWHITSTTGSVGAAVAVAKLLRLPPNQVAHAVGLAATQVTGLRCNFGSDAKPFHVGRAAQNGLLAALLAEQGFTADESEGVLEARRGWANVVTGGEGWNDEVRVLQQLGWFVGELGAVWEVERNSFKPFPCGIVVHPGIDAAVRLRREILKGIDGDEARLRERLARLTVKARVHPLVVELTGKKEPKDGLEAKFSVYHGVAVGLLYGKAGPAEYEDRVVNDPDVVKVRGSVEVAADPVSVIRSDETVMVAFEGQLPVCSVHVEHAVGSLDVPMTDEQLTEKFVDQVGLSFGRERAERLSQLCWRIGEVESVDELLKQLR